MLPGERNDIANETNPIDRSFVKRHGGRHPGEGGRAGHQEYRQSGRRTSVTVIGKNIWIYYHAPSVRGRHIFGGAGALRGGEAEAWGEDILKLFPDK